jgi:amino acid transporter
MTDLVTDKHAILTILIYIGATISCMACALASVNAFSRMLFSLGRYQFVHRTVGMVHQKHQTPYVAVTIGCVINFVVCAVFYKQAFTDLLGYFGTIASFGFILVYMACSIAAPVLMRKTGTVTTGDYVMGGLGTILMFLSLIGSVYPVPDAPYKYFPYGFAAYMLLGALWFGVLKVRMPQTLLGLEHDLETAVS